MVGGSAARGSFALEELEHTSQEFAAMKRLGDELVPLGMAPQRRRRKSRGEQTFDLGLQCSCSVKRGKTVEWFRQPDLGYYEGKRLCFDLTQRRLAIGDRRHREPLIEEGLRDQGTRRLITVDDEDLLFYRIHLSLFSRNARR
jgi:hypothetical protein